MLTIEITTCVVTLFCRTYGKGYSYTSEKWMQDKIAFMIIGYCRIPARDQGESLENQEETLLAHGCERIYKDIASGAKATRPGLEQAKEYARQGDTIVVTRLDRLGRSTIDTLKTVKELDERGIRIEALDTQVDTSTPAGRLVLSVIASLAEWERDLLIERTHEGLAHARVQGRFGGRPPKLTATQRQVALSSLQAGMSQRQVAESFGVSRATIARLKSESDSNISTTSKK